MSDGYVLDDLGNYQFSNPVPETTILKIASEILEKRALKSHEAITAVATAGQLLAAKLGSKEREIFAVLFLTTRHTLICYEELFFGTINGASIHPREIVKRALQLNAAALIVGHNHPSGDLSPSQADKMITERIQDALKLFDIRLLDHFIVGEGHFNSFSESGLI